MRVRLAMQNLGGVDAAFPNFVIISHGIFSDPLGSAHGYV
jgi:hypothetical protein